jgi:ABC-2 type transport system permease protein
VVVIISARVKGFQEAYQLGGLVVLPVIILLLAQVGGVVFLGPGLLLVAGGVLLALAAVVLRVGAASVARTRLGANL